MSLTRAGVREPNILQIPEERQRPWYMAGGQVCPTNSVIDTTTGLRNVLIFPDELPGEDRITDKQHVFHLFSFCLSRPINVPAAHRHHS
jgi:hypothetical protein